MKCYKNKSISVDLKAINIESNEYAEDWNEESEFLDSTRTQQRGNCFICVCNQNRFSTLFSEMNDFHVLKLSYELVQIHWHAIWHHRLTKQDLSKWPKANLKFHSVTFGNLFYIARVSNRYEVQNPLKLCVYIQLPLIEQFNYALKHFPSSHQTSTLESILWNWIYFWSSVCSSRIGPTDLELSSRLSYTTNLIF